MSHFGVSYSSIGYSKALSVGLGLEKAGLAFGIHFSALKNPPVCGIYAEFDKVVWLWYIEVRLNITPF